MITRADLVVAKAHAPAAVTAGGPVTYTITVTNAGPNDAPDSVNDVPPTAIGGPATFADDFPAGGHRRELDLRDHDRLGRCAAR